VNVAHQKMNQGKLSWKLRLGLRAVKRLPPLMVACAYDFKRYVVGSAILGSEQHRERMTGVITATYHNLEKGLSLPKPRPGFGVDNVAKLLGLLDQHIAWFGVDDVVRVAAKVLAAYRSFNQGVGASTSNDQAIDALLASMTLPEGLMAGTQVLSAADRQSALVGLDFFLSRHTVRVFEPKVLTADELSFAVQAAQKAPGVCNRQSGRVRFISDPARIHSTLAIQGGARGFAENVPNLFCITARVANFNGVGERYQAWIDGGLFAMSFLLGLHAQGIGACCLNWSKEPATDRQMRHHLGLPDDEIIIMFVAAGHAQQGIQVACSNRRPFEDVLVVDHG
jgi:nitroreductase